MTSVQVQVSKNFNMGISKNEQNIKKINELEEIIKNQNYELQKLKSSTNPFQREIVSLKNEIDRLTKENQVLKGNYQKEINIKEKVNRDLIYENKMKEDLIEANKKLQRQIEILNNKIMDMEKHIINQNEEYKGMEKVKGNYEEKIISLTNSIDKLKSKLNSCENIIRQKERYIQMLNNQETEKLKNNSLNNNLINTKFNNNNKSMIRPNSASKVNYERLIIDKDNTIKKLENKVRQLEKDNNNLIIRVRNFQKV